MRKAQHSERATFYGKHKLLTENTVLCEPMAAMFNLTQVFNKTIIQNKGITTKSSYMINFHLLN